MALTNWSNANYLNRTSQVLDSYPLLISCWYYWATLPGADTAVLCAVGVSGSGDNERRLNSQAGGVPEAFSRSTSNASAAATAGVSAAAWGHAFAEFIATNSRACLFAGTNRNTEGSTIAPTASNSVYVGRNTNASNAMAATGRIAEVSIWDGTSMSTANMDSLSVKLAGGENPININAEAAQPWTGKLVAYWPLTDTSDLADAAGHGHDLSMQGTLTDAASHPTIDAVQQQGGTTSDLRVRWRVT